jgi:hypothetical protein
MKKIDYYLIISILLIIWIDYMSYRLPSLIENSEKFEFLIINLSMAYIASYIFYYVNTILPQKHNNKIIRRVINNSVVFIINDGEKLNNYKNIKNDESFEIKENGEILNTEEFIEKNKKNLHYNLDMILVIKDRLPSELLHYSLLFKNHPYFRTNNKNYINLEKYIEAYNLLSTKLNNEFKKL